MFTAWIRHVYGLDRRWRNAEKLALAGHPPEAGGPSLSRIMELRLARVTNQLQRPPTHFAESRSLTNADVYLAEGRHGYGFESASGVPARGVYCGSEQHERNS